MENALGNIRKKKKQCPSVIRHLHSYRGGHWGLRYCGIGQFFLRYFSNFNLKLRYCCILRTCGMRFFSILDGIINYRAGPLTFFEPFPVSDWTFPMKLIVLGNGKLQFLALQS